MRKVGVTAWIKSTLLCGVDFDRRGCPGQGTATRGLMLGRKVDAAFKELCQTGAVPGGATIGVKRRTRVIAAALQRAGVRPTGANVFVTRGQLKTHMDGVATAADGTAVVLELKCTQASLKNHELAYDVPCSRQPTITVAGVQLPNTERTHHQLQLAFGVLASGSAGGFVIVSTSNGAKLYRLNTALRPALFDVPPAVTAPAARPIRRRGPKRAKSTVPWPGASVALPGWNDHGTITKEVVLVRNSRGAVAAAVAATTATTAVRNAVRRAASSANVASGLICVPTGGKWKCYRLGPKYMRDGKES